MTEREEQEAEYEMLLGEVETLAELAKEGRLVSAILIYDYVDSAETRDRLVFGDEEDTSVIDVEEHASIFIGSGGAAEAMTNMINNNVLPELSSMLDSE